jgi:hypothetical protein
MLDLRNCRSELSGCGKPSLLIPRIEIKRKAVQLPA